MFSLHLPLLDQKYKFVNEWNKIGPHGSKKPAAVFDTRQFRKHFQYNVANITQLKGVGVPPW